MMQPFLSASPEPPPSIGPHWFGSVASSLIPPPPPPPLHLKMGWHIIFPPPSNLPAFTPGQFCLLSSKPPASLPSPLPRKWNKRLQADESLCSVMVAIHHWEQGGGGREAVRMGWWESWKRSELGSASPLFLPPSSLPSLPPFEPLCQTNGR